MARWLFFSRGTEHRRRSCWMSPHSKLVWQSRYASLWPTQSNNLARCQPGSACKLLRRTGGGAAPEQMYHPLGSGGHRRLPRHCLCVPVTHTSFLTPLLPVLEPHKTSPCTGHQLWDLCANKDQLEKTPGRSGRPQSFSVGNDEFHRLNTTQAENLLAVSRPH